jgi:hypothetical protein
MQPYSAHGSLDQRGTCYRIGAGTPPSLSQSQGLIRSDLRPHIYKACGLVCYGAWWLHERITTSFK